MQDTLNSYYDIFRAVHIIAVISWMAGMLYLPRLFVYHVDAVKGGELSETLKIMEKRLFRYIMTPAMVAAWVFGGAMLYARWDLLMSISHWMHAKLLFVVLMTVVHHIYIKYLKAFREDRNQKTAKFFRILNEVPTILMIIIVVLAVVEPF
ncbi:MAG: protoporphyrinogen oxidase HemJ [Alphaproteobacteria bacterium]